MDSPDVLLIERLRKENLDQFLTLVRMHLSFVVDINTDDVDCSTDKPKQFRWNFHKKIKNAAPSSSQQTNGNGGKIGAEANSITEEGILRLNELIDFLSLPENVTQEGIFRRTGSLTRQQELKQLLLTGSSLGLDEGRFSVHDCASVLKGFLAELPQPLLMDQYYQTYCTLAGQYPPNAEPSEPKLLTALQLLLLLLAPLHRNFLQRLLTLLTLVADNEASNRMSPDTLATMFTPHLLCPRKLSPETFHADAIALSPVISFMIRLSARLFLAPPQLATDARAYFSARCRLDESVSDKTAANTVFTFVDRGRSAAENSSNPTDTALAQLYAHIQALPDSAHKRRLIKHFNRQNGYGTPIQIQRTGKAAGSRSFGDSIKRHIFNKGLLNKTPKKGSGPTINSIEEKKKRLDDKTDVLHKNIVLKNLVQKIASSESLDEDYDSEASNESTLSEGAITRRRKTSPKFVSEPNLSMIDCEETPKNTKKGTRLFRSKLLSASQNINKKYQKRNTIIRGTPTSCVSCFDEQDTGSENDLSYNSPIKETPKKRPNEDFRIHYLTSTPGIVESPILDECATPYVNFRRASMSPITKSTQKLSKAMQESIMTPRSRKPLIITCEQRDVACERDGERDAIGRGTSGRGTCGRDTSGRGLSGRGTSGRGTPSERDATCEPSALEIARDNDSDFVSSDDDTRSSFSCERSINTSIPRSRTFEGRSFSAGDISPLRTETTRFILSHHRPLIEDLNATLEPPRITVNQVEQTRSLTEPFREYLLSRSVLTATPVDLSILNNSKNKEEMSDSLLYCLDGNVPSDLTSSIGNLAVNSDLRSPLKHVNKESPNRKRASSLVCKNEEIGTKKALVIEDTVKGITNEYRPYGNVVKSMGSQLTVPSFVEKENVCEPIYAIRETDL